ncbi:MAG TPA: hypothetical protein ENJ08_10685, partial [Gammaproteobacteria bacterium]|nr:hypothetical protein [Gammaproteobacteria bacterium]
AYVLTSTTPGPKIERYFDIQNNSNTLKLTEIRDEQGNQQRLSYHEGRLYRISADHGDIWKLYYTEQGQLSHVQWHMSGTPTDEAPQQKNLVQYHYDQHDDLIRATDAAGNAEHYAYHNHLLTRRQLKSGYSFYFQWDRETSEARCIRNWGDKINDQPTYDYRFQWDTRNRRVKMTDTRGGVERYQFNERGLPVYHQDAEGGETHYQYDSLGNLTTQIDPLGHKAHFTYDYNNQLASYTSKEGYQQRLIRDYQGQVTQITDALGQTWLRKYNNQGQLINQSNPLGETHHYEYNELGLVSRITDPTGSQWQYIWDNRAQLTAIRNPLGQHTRYTHNAEGQLTQISWPDKQITKYQYDANNHCIAIKAPDGQVSQFAYNPLGLLTHHKDSSNRVTEYQYNGLSQVVRRIDPGKQTLDYHYDGERNLIGLTNEKGEHYQLKYDLAERLIQEIGFDGRVQRYHYNKAGQLTDSADYSHDGKTLLSHISYQRDPLGRLLEQTNNITRQSLNAFHYDPLGRLTHAKNAHQRLQWEYDPAGRIIKDHQGKQVTEHQYNKAGQRTGSILPSGARVDYQFDEAGSFSGLNYNGDTVAQIQRDAMGRETRRTLSNQLVTDHSYDPQGRLQRQRTARQQREAAAPTTALSERQYHYNTQGQLSQIDDQIRGRVQYHYDALDRLVQVDGPRPERFVHDPAGNILAMNTPEHTQQSGEVKGNRITLQGDSHYQYDARGNRSLQLRGKDQKLKTYYRYNALNQLEEVRNNNQRIYYVYDPLGRRIAKSSDAGVTHFLWMDDVLMYEGTQKNNVRVSERLYLFEPGTFKPLAFVENKQVYHYHLDHLGTPQEITDARGNIVWAVSFKAYGNLAVAYENQIENNLRFQGQYFDQETGLHYNRFRYYDPNCGRFINQDPIGLAGGNNNYLYVPNPTGWIDPFGLVAKDCPDAVANSSSEKNSSFPDEVFSSKAPKQVTPGTRTLEGQHINDRGRVEPWKAEYDEYGRLKARTDYNAGNKAQGIPDTHHHIYEWGAGKTPMEIGSHLPGEYKP